MASEDPHLHQQGTAVKKEHVAYKSSSETGNNWEDWKWQKPKCEYCILQHWIISRFFYKNTYRTNYNYLRNEVNV
jgi:hypothetical protein